MDIVLIPGIPFAVGSLFIIGYANMPWPIDNKVNLEPIRDDIEKLIVLVHGKVTGHPPGQMVLQAN